MAMPELGWPGPWRGKGRGWLQWCTGKLARYGLVPEAGDAAAAVAYLEHERALTLADALRAGWSVIIVGRSTDVPPGQILRDAQQQLRIIRHCVALPWDTKTGFPPAARVVRVAVGGGLADRPNEPIASCVAGV
jgi:hypothetical protein